MEVVQQLEAAYEELEATVDELRATREELACRNEQLETAGEEMRALNEALRAVNAELRSKVEALSRSDDDLENLLQVTDDAVIFLDADVRIRRFTARAGEVAGLGAEHLGRPLEELTTRFQTEELEGCVRAVLDTVVPEQIEVQSETGRRYLMRILPRRTGQNLIDGLVVVLCDPGEFRSATDGDA